MSPHSSLHGQDNPRQENKNSYIALDKCMLGGKNSIEDNQKLEYCDLKAWNRLISLERYLSSYIVGNGFIMILL